MDLKGWTEKSESSSQFEIDRKFFKTHGEQNHYVRFVKHPDVAPNVRVISMITENSGISVAEALGIDDDSLKNVEATNVISQSSAVISVEEMKRIISTL